MDSGSWNQLLTDYNTDKHTHRHIHAHRKKNTHYTSSGLACSFFPNMLSHFVLLWQLFLLFSSLIKKALTSIAILMKSSSSIKAPVIENISTLQNSSLLIHSGVGPLFRSVCQVLNCKLLGSWTMPSLSVPHTSIVSVLCKQ